MELKGILFDLDGTLADTLPVCIKAYQETVEHFGHWVPKDEEITQYFGTNEEGILERFFPGELKRTLPYYLKVYEKLHLEFCGEPFKGVDEIFSLLASKKIQTAIVTGKGSQSAEITMRILGLNRWIDILEPGFAFKADKPYSIKKVLDRFQIRPDQAAYVGDTPYDMQASYEAGLLPIGAAWAKSNTLNGTPITPTFSKFDRIEDFVAWVEHSLSNNF
jgi:pyrophosphatase PpaX